MMEIPDYSVQDRLERLHIIWESLKKERQNNSVILPRKRHFLGNFFSRKHKDELDLTEAPQCLSSPPSSSHTMMAFP